MPRVRKTAKGRRSRGFEPTALFVRKNLRIAAERRGFVFRLLTHWPEVVGEEIGRISKPVRVVFDSRSLLGTLTVNTPGACASELQMHVPRIIERVNAQYGYRAIDDVRIVHTPATWMQRETVQAGRRAEVTPEIRARAFAAVRGIEDGALRRELQELGQSVYARTASER